MLFFFNVPGCVLPRGNGPQTNPMVNFSIAIKHTHFMVKIKTSLSFGFCLEFQQIKETFRTISKVLRVATETIRTRWRKLT